MKNLLLRYIKACKAEFGVCTHVYLLKSSFQRKRTLFMLYLKNSKLTNDSGTTKFTGVCQKVQRQHHFFRFPIIPYLTQDRLINMHQTCTETSQNSFGHLYGFAKYNLEYITVCVALVTDARARRQTKLTRAAHLSNPIAVVLLYRNNCPLVVYIYAKKRIAQKSNACLIYKLSFRRSDAEEHQFQVSCSLRDRVSFKASKEIV